MLGISNHSATTVGFRPVLSRSELRAANVVNLSDVLSAVPQNGRMDDALFQNSIRERFERAARTVIDQWRQNKGDSRQFLARRLERIIQQDRPEKRFQYDAFLGDLETIFGDRLATDGRTDGDRTREGQIENAFRSLVDLLGDGVPGEWYETLRQMLRQTAPVDINQLFDRDWRVKDKILRDFSGTLMSLMFSRADSKEIILSEPVEVDHANAFGDRSVVAFKLKTRDARTGEEKDLGYRLMVVYVDGAPLEGYLSMRSVDDSYDNVYLRMSALKLNISSLPEMVQKDASSAKEVLRYFEQVRHSIMSAMPRKEKIQGLQSTGKHYVLTPQGFDRQAFTDLADHSNLYIWQLQHPLAQNYTLTDELIYLAQSKNIVGQRSYGVQDQMDTDSFDEFAAYVAGEVVEQAANPRDYFQLSGIQFQIYKSDVDLLIELEFLPEAARQSLFYRQLPADQEEKPDDVIGGVDDARMRQITEAEVSGEFKPGGIFSEGVAYSLPDSVHGGRSLAQISVHEMQHYLFRLKWEQLLPEQKQSVLVRFRQNHKQFLRVFPELYGYALNPIDAEAQQLEAAARSEMRRVEFARAGRTGEAEGTLGRLNGEFGAWTENRAAELVQTEAGGMLTSLAGGDAEFSQSEDFRNFVFVLIQNPVLIKYLAVLLEKSDFGKAETEEGVANLDQAVLDFYRGERSLESFGTSDLTELLAGSSDRAAVDGVLERLGPADEGTRRGIAGKLREADERMARISQWDMANRFHGTEFLLSRGISDTKTEQWAEGPARIAQPIFFSQFPGYALTYAGLEMTMSASVPLASIRRTSWTTFPVAQQWGMNAYEPEIVAEGAIRVDRIYRFDDFQTFNDWLDFQQSYEMTWAGLPGVAERDREEMSSERHRRSSEEIPRNVFARIVRKMVDRQVRGKAPYGIEHAVYNAAQRVLQQCGGNYRSAEAFFQSTVGRMSLNSSRDEIIAYFDSMNFSAEAPARSEMRGSENDPEFIQKAGDALARDPATLERIERIAAQGGLSRDTLIARMAQVYKPLRGEALDRLEAPDVIGNTEKMEAALADYLPSRYDRHMKYDLDLPEEVCRLIGRHRIYVQKMGVYAPRVRYVSGMIIINEAYIPTGSSDPQLERKRQSLRKCLLRLALRADVDEGSNFLCDRRLGPGNYRVSRISHWLARHSSVARRVLESYFRHKVPLVTFYRKNLMKQKRKELIDLIGVAILFFGFMGAFLQTFFEGLLTPNPYRVDRDSVVAVLPVSPNSMSDVTVQYNLPDQYETMEELPTAMVQRLDDELEDFKHAVAPQYAGSAIDYLMQYPQDADWRLSPEFSVFVRRALPALIADPSEEAKFVRSVLLNQQLIQAAMTGSAKDLREALYLFAGDNRELRQKIDLIVERFLTEGAEHPGDISGHSEFSIIHSFINEIATGDPATVVLKFSVFTGEERVPRYYARYLALRAKFPTMQASRYTRIFAVPVIDGVSPEESLTLLSQTDPESPEGRQLFRRVRLRPVGELTEAQRQAYYQTGAEGLRARNRRERQSLGSDDPASEDPARTEGPRALMFDHLPEGIKRWIALSYFMQNDRHRQSARAAEQTDAANRRAVRTLAGLEARANKTDAPAEDRTQAEAARIEAFKKYYVHAVKTVDIAGQIVREENLPVEVLGYERHSDAAPYNVDFSELGLPSERGVVPTFSRVSDLFENITSAGYGGIFILYDRERMANPANDAGAFQTWRGRFHDDRLAPMVAPRSYVAGILLNGRYTPELLSRLKSEIARGDFYIPIYDRDGNLLFTPGEYDRLHRIRQGLPVSRRGQQAQVAQAPRALSQPLQQELRSPGDDFNAVVGNHLRFGVQTAGGVQDMELWKKVAEERADGRGVLGEHIRDAVRNVSAVPEFELLDDEEKEDALLALLFHDVGKSLPAYRALLEVAEGGEDVDHIERSERMARRILELRSQWNLSPASFQTILIAVRLHSLVTDQLVTTRGSQAALAVRENLRDHLPPGLSPEQRNRILRVLYVVNKADALLAAGADRDLLGTAYDVAYDKAKLFPGAQRPETGPPAARSEMRGSGLDGGDLFFNFDDNDGIEIPDDRTPRRKTEDELRAILAPPDAPYHDPWYSFHETVRLRFEDYLKDRQWSAAREKAEGHPEAWNELQQMLRPENLPREYARFVARLLGDAHMRRAAGPGHRVNISYDTSVVVADMGLVQGRQASEGRITIGFKYPGSAELYTDREAYRPVLELEPYSFELGSTRETFYHVVPSGNVSDFREFVLALYLSETMTESAEDGSDDATAQDLAIDETALIDKAGKLADVLDHVAALSGTELPSLDDIRQRRLPKQKRISPYRSVPMDAEPAEGEWSLYHAIKLVSILLSQLNGLTDRPADVSAYDWLLQTKPELSAQNEESLDDMTEGGVGLAEKEEGGEAVVSEQPFAIILAQALRMLEGIFESRKDSHTRDDVRRSVLDAKHGLGEYATSGPTEAPSRDVSLDQVTNRIFMGTGLVQALADFEEAFRKVMDSDSRGRDLWIQTIVDGFGAGGYERDAEMRQWRRERSEANSQMPEVIAYEMVGGLSASHHKTWEDSVWKIERSPKVERARDGSSTITFDITRRTMDEFKKYWPENRNLRVKIQTSKSGQRSLTLSLFRRSDAQHIVGVETYQIGRVAEPYEVEVRTSRSPEGRDLIQDSGAWDTVETQKQALTVRREEVAGQWQPFYDGHARDDLNGIGRALFHAYLQVRNEDAKDTDSAAIAEALEHLMAMFDVLERAHPQRSESRVSEKASAAGTEASDRIPARSETRDKADVLRKGGFQVFWVGNPWDGSHFGVKWDDHQMTIRFPYFTGGGYQDVEVQKNIVGGNSEIYAPFGAEVQIVNGNLVVKQSARRDRLFDDTGEHIFGQKTYFKTFQNVKIGLGPQPLDFSSAEERGLPYYKLSFSDQSGQKKDLLIIEGIKYLLGRDPEQADIVVRNDKVTRAHAELWIENGNLHICDLNSRNGTRINDGEPVTGEVSLPLPGLTHSVYLNVIDDLLRVSAAEFERFVKTGNMSPPIDAAFRRFKIGLNLSEQEKLSPELLTTIIRTVAVLWHKTERMRKERAQTQEPPQAPEPDMEASSIDVLSRSDLLKSHVTTRFRAMDDFERLRLDPRKYEGRNIPMQDLEDARVAMAREFHPDRLNAIRIEYKDDEENPKITFRVLNEIMKRVNEAYERLKKRASPGGQRSEVRTVKAIGDKKLEVLEGIIDVLRYYTPVGGDYQKILDLYTADQFSYLDGITKEKYQSAGTAMRKIPLNAADIDFIARTRAEKSRLTRMVGPLLTARKLALQTEMSIYGTVAVSDEETHLLAEIRAKNIIDIGFNMLVTSSHPVIATVSGTGADGESRLFGMMSMIPGPDMKTYFDAHPDAKTDHVINVQRGEKAIDPAFEPIDLTGPGIYFIGDIVISPDARGEGLGITLQREAFELAKASGATVIRGTTRTDSGLLDSAVTGAPVFRGKEGPGWNVGRDGKPIPVVTYAIVLDEQLQKDLAAPAPHPASSGGQRSEVRQTPQRAQLAQDLQQIENLTEFFQTLRHNRRIRFNPRGPRDPKRYYVGEYWLDEFKEFSQVRDRINITHGYETPIRLRHTFSVYPGDALGLYDLLNEVLLAKTGEVPLSESEIDARLQTALGILGEKRRELETALNPQGRVPPVAPERHRVTRYRPSVVPEPVLAASALQRWNRLYENRNHWQHPNDVTFSHYEFGIVPREERPVVYNLLDSMANRLWKATGRPEAAPQVFLLETDQIIVRISPEGNIYMSLGFLKMLADFRQGAPYEEDIACVLAHEMGHHLQRLEGAQFDKKADKLAAEYDADRRAQDLMNEVGYSSRTMTDFYRAIQQYAESRRFAAQRRLEDDQRRCERLMALAETDDFDRTMDGEGLALLSGDRDSRAFLFATGRALSSGFKEWLYRHRDYFNPEWEPERPGFDEESKLDHMINAVAASFGSDAIYSWTDEELMIRLKSASDRDFVRAIFAFYRDQLAVQAQAALREKEDSFLAGIPFLKSHPLDDRRIHRIQAYRDTHALKHYGEALHPMSEDAMREIRAVGTAEADMAAIRDGSTAAIRERVSDPLRDPVEIIFFLARLDAGQLTSELYDWLAEEPVRRGWDAETAEVFRFWLNVLFARFADNEHSPVTTNPARLFDAMLLVPQSQPAILTDGAYQGDYANLARFLGRVQEECWYWLDVAAQAGSEGNLLERYIDVVLEARDEGRASQKDLDRANARIVAAMESFTGRVSESLLLKLFRFARTGGMSLEFLRTYNEFIYRQLRSNPDFIRVMRQHPEEARDGLPLRSLQGEVTDAVTRMAREFAGDVDGADFKALGSSVPEMFENLFALFVTTGADLHRDGEFYFEWIALLHRKALRMGMSDFEFVRLASDFLASKGVAKDLYDSVLDRILFAQIDGDTPTESDTETMYNPGREELRQFYDRVSVGDWVEAVNGHGNVIQGRVWMKTLNGIGIEHNGVREWVNFYGGSGTEWYVDVDRISLRRVLKNTNVEVVSIDADIDSYLRQGLYAGHEQGLDQLPVRVKRLMVLFALGIVPHPSRLIGSYLDHMPMEEVRIFYRELRTRCTLSVMQSRGLEKFVTDEEKGIRIARFEPVDFNDYLMRIYAYQHYRGKHGAQWRDAMQTAARYFPEEMPSDSAVDSILAQGREINEPVMRSNMPRESWNVHDNMVWDEPHRHLISIPAEEIFTGPMTLAVFESHEEALRERFDAARNWQEVAAIVADEIPP
ncbi:MAG: FHA domain-containing protein, partial [Candidatus Omnitrophica bacterium]|nr:FHA domain-containing protein [Candidatus Omnitrophota bacterium]